MIYTSPEPKEKAALQEGIILSKFVRVYVAAEVIPT